MAWHGVFLWVWHLSEHITWQGVWAFSKTVLSSVQREVERRKIELTEIKQIFWESILYCIFGRGGGLFGERCFGE